MIAPEPGEGGKSQTSRLILLRNNLLVVALIFGALECWRPFFFLTDDNLDGGLPNFTQIGTRLLSGQSPFIADHLFGGDYNLLRDPSYFAWNPVYLVVSLLAGTPLHHWILDTDAFVLFMLAAAGFVNLAWYLRRELDLAISDRWIMFYTMSFVFSMMAITTAASWITFMGNQSALPWLALGILQKDWRKGLGLVTLFSLHQLTGGHLAPTVAGTFFMSLFALGVSLHRKSITPLSNWLVGLTVATVVLLPLIVPMASGFFASTRAQGVGLEDMQTNNVPFNLFPTSLFFGTAAWVAHPIPHQHTTYTIALGSAAAAWCALLAVISRAKWRGLEIVTGMMLITCMIMITRPLWISEIMIHTPVLRSMRWPFREFLQFQFFLHLFLVLRPQGLTPFVQRATAALGTCLMIVPMLMYPLPPTFNSMSWDRELIMTGGFDQYWAKVRPLLQPSDRIAVIIPISIYDADKGNDRYETPYSLLGTYDYAALAGVVNAGGYSPTPPADQLYVHRDFDHMYPFGAYIYYGDNPAYPNPKTMLLEERPDLKFIMLESLHPLKITLSSRNGPTIDLTPYAPARIGKPAP